METKTNLDFNKVNSRFKGLLSFWQRFKRNRSAYISLIIIIFFFFLTIFAPSFMNLRYWGVHADIVLNGPSLEHIMGTDNLGRDVFSGVVYGTRISLTVGIISALVSIFVGTFIGALAGYMGGITDHILMRFSECMTTIPSFFLMLVIAAIYGSSILNIILIIGLFNWMGTARQVRAQFMSLKEREYVLAAKAGGVSDFRIMYKHILPNGIHPVIIQASLAIPSGILAESGLAYLGLSDVRFTSWGQQLRLAQNYLRVAWWMSLFPGLMIFLTVICLNQIGDGLNDALNPRLNEG